MSAHHHAHDVPHLPSQKAWVLDDTYTVKTSESGIFSITTEHHGLYIPQAGSKAQPLHIVFNQEVYALKRTDAVRLDPEMQSADRAMKLAGVVSYEGHFDEQSAKPVSENINDGLYADEKNGPPFIAIIHGRSYRLAPEPGA